MTFIREDGNIIEAECEDCGRILKLRKNQLEFSKPVNNKYFCTEPVVCFCETSSKEIKDVPESNSQPVVRPMPTQNSTPKRDVPHCPTCGSENVEKIPLSSKAVGGAMFGIFSSNIRNTYRCRNCGYKW